MVLYKQKPPPTSFDYLACFGRSTWPQISFCPLKLANLFFPLLYLTMNEREREIELHQNSKEFHFSSVEGDDPDLALLLGGARVTAVAALGNCLLSSRCCCCCRYLLGPPDIAYCCARPCTYCRASSSSSQPPAPSMSLDML